MTKQSIRQHKIKLDGSSAHGARIPFSVISELASASLDAARRIIRLHAEGRSHLQSKPTWLDSASEIELLGLAEGSTEVIVESTPLSVTTPGIFEQLRLWDSGVSKDDTPFTLLESALREASEGNRDSNLYDNVILTSLLRFKFLFHLGYTNISFGDYNTSPFTLTPENIKTIESLQKTSPEEKRVKVSGKLDELKHSRNRFELKIKGGRVVRGFFPHDTEGIEQLWGKRVTVEGLANYKPSGNFSVLLAERIYPSGKADRIFEEVPDSINVVQRVSPIKRQPSSGKKTYEEVFGKFDASLSDKELDELLEAIR